VVKQSEGVGTKSQVVCVKDAAPSRFSQNVTVLLSETTSLFSYRLSFDPCLRRTAIRNAHILSTLRFRYLTPCLSAGSLTSAHLPRVCLPYWISLMPRSLTSSLPSSAPSYIPFPFLPSSPLPLGSIFFKPLAASIATLGNLCFVYPGQETYKDGSVRSNEAA